MEPVEGRPFGEAAVEPADRMRLPEQAARGVAAAHTRGVVQRDLMPANLLAPREGTGKVGDFGLVHALDTRSELTRTGTTLGTPLYMAPEKVEGRADAVGPPTDVHALGAMLYEILAGRPPIQAESFAELYRRIDAEEPPLPPGPTDAGGEAVLARPAGPLGLLWRRATCHRRALLLAASSWRQSVRLLGELARLTPDPRPWRPVFDGSSAACFLVPDAPGWRLRDGTLENIVPDPSPVRATGTPGARGTIHISCVGGTPRLPAIESRKRRFPATPPPRHGLIGA
jgi:serine/threonine protein kinase